MHETTDYEQDVAHTTKAQISVQDQMRGADKSSNVEIFEL
jgi:hypothetical protein